MIDKAFYDNLTYNEIIESLTVDDVISFLVSLGVEKIERNGNYLCCPTICHNPIEDAESMKLYYYFDRKLFHCYTECGDSFNIFELYRRYMSVNFYEPSKLECIEYIRSFISETIPIKNNKNEKSISSVNRDIYKNNSPIFIKEYSVKTLDVFQNKYHPSWISEGISIDAMKKFNIKFYVMQNEIIIPHFDINGRMIGIRARAIDYEDMLFGKYHPVRIGDNEYSHQLSWNLYGINEHKSSIKKYKRAVIVEAEKSVLKSETFFGEDSVAVACCGSQINRAQIRLLASLGVNEIVIALDKEFVDYKSEKAKKYRNKIVSICNKYKDAAKFSYIFDEGNLLEEKDSPYDKGEEIFMKLYNNRIFVKG